MGTLAWRQGAGSIVAPNLHYRGNKHVSYICKNHFFSGFKKSLFKKLRNEGFRIILAFIQLKSEK